MAVVPVVNPTLAGVAYTKAVASASPGGDTFAAQTGGKYLVQIENGATPTVVTFDDVNTSVPPGAAANTTFADVAVSVAASTNKAVWIAANRFLNAGVVKMTAAPETTVKFSVFGPL